MEKWLGEWKREPHPLIYYPKTYSHISGCYRDGILAWVFQSLPRLRVRTTQHEN
jgi:hypothetical protein